ncbi:hypothetical protein PRIC2_012816 [Phytophthora ramorum]
MWRRLARSSVVVTHRSARRIAIPRPHVRLPLCLPFPQQLAASSQTFSSAPNAHSGVYRARANDVKVRDIALSELVQRPWVELQEFYGPVEMSKVRQTLPLLWKELSSETEGGAKVPPEIAQDFYEIARLRRLFKLQGDAFSYVEDHYLERVSFEMYGQMFNILVTTKDPQRMRDIFERAMTRYDPELGQVPPEIVYRLGITASIMLEDYRGMKTLLREMEVNRVRPSIEITTRVIVAQAKKGDVQTVVAAAEKLNPQDGRKWHEADINRVITSLGIAGEPDAAFDFYRRSEIRLSPQTLMKLMLVCRGNSRSQHALAILANRRRFGLKMQPAQYPALLEIIEELGIAGAPASEMAVMLKEMRDNGVAFNDRTHALIARNQQHLHGTPFMLTPTVLVPSSELAQEGAVAQSRTKEADMPLLNELLETRKFAQAAAIVDLYALPVSNDMLARDAQQEPTSAEDEATIVPAWLADLAIEAYSQNQEVDKVRSLLRGFMRVRGNFKHALSRIVGLFGGKGKLRDGRMAYEAFLAMQFQGLRIFRIRDALVRFKQYQDTNAALGLLKQVSRQIAEALQDTDSLENARNHPEDFMAVLKSSGALHFDPGRAVRDILRIVLASKELGMVFTALDQLESDGIPLRAVDFEIVFSAMSKLNSGESKTFSEGDFMVVWEDMTQRSVVPSKAIVRLVIPELCGQGGKGGNEESKRRKLAVIEGYRQAAKIRHDNYVLPASCFTTLLESAAEVGSIEDVSAVHAGAVKALGAAMNKKHHSVGDHSKILETWNAIKTKKMVGQHAAV